MSRSKIEEQLDLENKLYWYGVLMEPKDTKECFATCLRTDCDKFFLCEMHWGTN